MNTIGTRTCALSESAQRPQPVRIPAPNASAPITRITSTLETLESSTRMVETIDSAKPVSIVRALTRHGAGKSEMLAPIAPSVAGCPAPKPRRSEATSVTVATLAATLSPLAMCCPTRYLSSVGDLSQWRMERILGEDFLGD